ncbi:hypothetical protein, partial [Candidatus Venteria ishoeyi]
SSNRTEKQIGVANIEANKIQTQTMIDAEIIKAENDNAVLAKLGELEIKNKKLMLTNKLDCLRLRLKKN